jgi:hypothetical protein
MSASVVPRPLLNLLYLAQAVRLFKPLCTSASESARPFDFLRIYLFTTHVGGRGFPSELRKFRSNGHFPHLSSERSFRHARDCDRGILNA